MEALLSFIGSAGHDPAVARWFESRPDELGSIARQWFSTLRACGPDTRELIHDGCPVVCVQDAPFGYVNAFRAHVNLGFFRGASLPDPAHLLQGAGKYMRHVKLKPGETPNDSALQELVSAAYKDMGARLEAANRANQIA
jgi:hypothetical protein